MSSLAKYGSLSSGSKKFYCFDQPDAADRPRPLPPRRNIVQRFPPPPRRFRQTWKSLDEILKEYNIKLLNVVWLATDFCVWATVLDGLEKWYDVNFHKNWSAWVFPTVEHYQVYENMKSAWANFI